MCKKFIVIRSDGADLQLFRSDGLLTAELNLFFYKSESIYNHERIFFVPTSVCCTCYGSGINVPRFEDLSRIKTVFLFFMFLVLTYIRRIS